jgi:hypothetical protein
MEEKGKGEKKSVSDQQNNKSKSERDISSIDQQEGNLKNGELGGNLDDRVSEENKYKKASQ